MFFPISSERHFEVMSKNKDFYGTVAYMSAVFKLNLKKKSA